MEKLPGLRLGRFVYYTHKRMPALLGKKVKMTQIWKENKVIPVTVIEAQPNAVSLLRTKEKDGYEAIQLAMGKRKKEFKNIDSGVKVGETLNVDIFKEGDVVAVSGVSKGRGFQGVVKRHGFHGGPKTHGQKNRLRAPGSIGSTAPQRVFPGRRMAGRMGGTRITVKNMVVAGVDIEHRQLFLRGAVPGAPGGFIEIVKVAKK